MAAAATEQKSSQDIIDDFWRTHITTAKPITKAFAVLPSNVYAQLVSENVPTGDVGGRSVTVSYEEAVKQCEKKVTQIVAECRRNNQKYSDPHFKLEVGAIDPIYPLSAPPPSRLHDGTSQNNVVTYQVTQVATTPGPLPGLEIQPVDTSPRDDANDPPPQSVKRVGDIFEAPRFYIDGAKTTDTRQGAEGDCWFISALGSLCTETSFMHLIERVCPENARDEQVGVYGFVFYKDGEWISEIIDDKLYLQKPDYDDWRGFDRDNWVGFQTSSKRVSQEQIREEYRKAFQSGSSALYYGQCADPNETWVPLLEKAFAKAHGDYKAISGGSQGEGIEDLTGGITTTVVTADILDKDEFWSQGLLKVNEEFLFGAGTDRYGGPDSAQRGRQGIEDTHAYSVIRATTYNDNRLLLVKNPWGGLLEWNGPWSDGSEEWTVDAMAALGHRFGDDGIFWIPYQDFLRRFATIWRTRLFSPEWQVTQKWATLQIPWAGDYNDTKFEVEIPTAARTAVVLSKLDDRYFRGLRGQYLFPEFSFRLHKAGETTHLVRGRTLSFWDRAANVEIDLEAGKYEVFMKIAGERDESEPKIEDVVKANWLDRRDKLLRIGLAHDLAHAKAHIEVPATNVSAKEAATAPIEAVKDTAEATKKVAGEVGATVNEALTSWLKPSKTDAQDLDGSQGQAVPSSSADSDKGPDPAPAPAPADPEKDDKEPDDEDNAPWDASCVVSLRVFCLNTAATIRVVTKAMEEAEKKKVQVKRLDVDDPEKDILSKVTSRVGVL